MENIKFHVLLIDIDLHMVFTMINQYSDTSKGQVGAHFEVENKHFETKKQPKT